jgi:hypothetical protein
MAREIVERRLGAVVADDAPAIASAIQDLARPATSERPLAEHIRAVFDERYARQHCTGAWLDLVRRVARRAS